jgi:transcriptional regulator with XRE-family HTH domain
MKLKQWRLTQGLSVEELASRVDSSERAVIKWERGERRPRPETLMKIMAITDGAVSWGDFFDSAEESAA